MNITEIKNKIQNGGFDNDFVMLYGDAEKAKALILEAIGRYI